MFGAEQGLLGGTRLACVRMWSFPQNKTWHLLPDTFGKEAKSVDTKRRARNTITRYIYLTSAWKV